ncbi:MAG: hypothetical protein J6A59_01465 [Lachnospiraceae bacterium]|nr:hypothetical protein [Lachnospiraceae bacterium]
MKEKFDMKQYENCIELVENKDDLISMLEMMCDDTSHKKVESIDIDSLFGD